MPRQMTRFRLKDNIVSGLNRAFASTGWRTALRMRRPYAVHIEGNDLFGYANPSARDVDDFVANSYGVLVEPGYDFSTDLVMSANKVLGFLNACEINNMEAVTIRDRNDFQLCFNGPKLTNPGGIKNQVNFVDNHVAVSGAGTTIELFRQFMVSRNQFDFAQGSPETQTLHLLNIDQSFFGHIVDNVFRAGEPGDTTMWAIRLKEGATTGVLDIVAAGNRFQDLGGAWFLDGDLSRIARVKRYGNAYRLVDTMENVDTSAASVWQDIDSPTELVSTGSFEKLVRGQRVRTSPVGGEERQTENLLTLPVDTVSSEPKTAEVLIDHVGRKLCNLCRSHAAIFVDGKIPLEFNKTSLGL
jgi:hypothetical protein